jgi:hypothetical protein
VKLSFKIWNEFACFGARGGILPAQVFDPLRHSVGSPGFVGGLVIWFIGRVARHYLAGR